MRHAPASPTVKDQISAAIVDVLNTLREGACEKLQSIQDVALDKALDRIRMVRDFVGSPENILGNPNTKHGEIAEHVEVGVRNARSLLYGEALTAEIESVGRTDKVDYLIDGIGVQSKFYNGARNTLDLSLIHI